MSRRIESRRMQRARRRRRQLIVKMIMVLILLVVSVSVLVTLIGRMSQKSEAGAAPMAHSGFHVEGAMASTAQKTEELTEKEAPPLKDQEPPVIKGVEELTVPEGSSVSYKRNVTAIDNRDGEVALNVDASMVDLNTQGDYTIIYTAQDAAGNKAEVSTVVHVVEAGADTATEEFVNAAADQLLLEITNEDMTDYEKAEAIFYWVHDMISYTDSSPKDNWVAAAYRGLVEQKGDCYVYAMTSKCLLTRAGITNMDIEKIPSSTEHYWNLIDLGDGWYHFDATRRRDKTYFFYATDAELMEYSNSHYGSHNYDPAKYPEIQ